MLLLYLRFSSSRTTPYSDLHSTMLLLYRKTGWFYHWHDHIYIPLCFYFIAWSKIQRNIFRSIYIPLCFYFIQAAPPILYAVISIYIPLCFYFICVLIVTGRLICDLHSTMLLLYHHPQAHEWRMDTEFTFHYASTLSPVQILQKFRDVRIYIPLCFYFITTSATTVEPILTHLHSTMLLLYHALDDYEVSDLKGFTFHYASTLSRWVYRVADERDRFTFHYASTLSRVRSAVEKHIFQIYIPLCFYFIYKVILIVLQRYVIYIPLCFYFISYASFCYPVWSFIYIPLCFYFIPQILTVYTHQSYLHSTMLLLYPLSPLPG